MSEERGLIAAQEELRQLSTMQEKQLLQMSEMIQRMTSAIGVLEARIRQMEQTRVTATSRDVKQLRARIAARAQAICDRYSLDYRADGAAFRAAIQKDVYRQYGIDDLHDLPAAYLALAAALVDGWASYALVKKVRDKHGTMC